MGAESGGGNSFQVVVPTPTPGSSQAEGRFDNEGRIVAANGGKVTIRQEGISGNGSIDVSHGGVLALAGLSSIAASQRLDLGGESASTLEFAPRAVIQSAMPFGTFGSEIDAEIRGFAKTNLINIKGFVGNIVGVAASGNDDTTVTFSGTASYPPTLSTPL